MKNLLIVAALLVVALLDYDFCCVVVARGGWNAYVATNCMWQSVVAFLGMWHIVAAVTMWVIWTTRKDF